MYQVGYINHTKLAAPRRHRRTLQRERLTTRLLESLEHQLTIVHAGTGYGKTTALAALTEENVSVVWYHLDAEDADPLVFLLHLIYGFNEALDGQLQAPLALLEQWEGERRSSPWQAVVDLLSSELATFVRAPLLLVIDDAHWIRDAPASLRILDRLIGRMPLHVHPLVSTRHPLPLPGLVNWRVHGQLLEIGQDELAFTAGETASLFREQYALSLTSEQIELLTSTMEGWPIGLQLVWQRLQRDGNETINQALADLAGSTGDLFVYLAQEVLVRQPADIQAFLRSSAILRQMSAAACNCLRSAGDSEQILRYLLENELFVVDLGHGQLRYHHMFRDFLRRQLAQDEARIAHQRAASCCQQLGNNEEAIYHLLAAEAYSEAADVLNQLGRGMVRAGRLDTLLGWIEALPPVVLQRQPSLMVFLGDIARLHSRFDEALGWYKQAEQRSRAAGELPGIGQALRGQARVYLDTVDASQAEQLLQEALRLADGQDDRDSRARLLELLAENLINRGRLQEAEQYQSQARELREEGPAEAELSVRLLLRTGRLAQARRVLEERAENERREPVLRPRAHRETLLLLSLILSFSGEGAEALRCAVEGTERGQALQSHFITAVGHMRQGHAWLVQKDEAGYERAAGCFLQTVALSEQLEVPRLKIEAYWGLCQAYGFRGDLAEAQRVARQGIQMAQDVGDAWVEACIRLTMGATYALATRNSDSATWLIQAGAIFRECGDTHGQAVARLWQCLVWRLNGDEARLKRDITELLQLVRVHGYDYLFMRETLLGPPDPRSLVPLLLFAREVPECAAFADTLLNRLGLGRLSIHPGYQLRVQTLGPFRTWRGQMEVTPYGWRRKKSRQLFQLLLTQRSGMLDRERIVDLLWPELGPEEAQRDFKSALSALYNVLEPGRQRNGPSAFICRDGLRYGLRVEADIWVDAWQFEALIKEGRQLFKQDPAKALDLYRTALNLYQGEYLQEYPYSEWCSEERERLLTTYLRTAERLARALLVEENWEEAIEVCWRILARDDCWENAYRIMMVSYDKLGNRPQAFRIFRRCENRLRIQLDIQPAPTTIRLYESIRAQHEILSNVVDRRF